MKYAVFLLLVLSWGARAQLTELDKTSRNQKREVIPNLPTAIQADTAKLTFQVSALSAKGLLSQQIKDAVKSIWKANGGGAVLKLRAFVASSGDLRRVQSIVAEMFAGAIRPLPVLTVVQVGQLPLTGAQVILEAVSEAKKPANPSGLAFISSFPSGDIGAALTRIKDAVEAARALPQEVLALTCFAGSLDEYAEMRKRAGQQFPKAALNLVQAQRSPERFTVQCEAVAKLKAAPRNPVDLIDVGRSGSDPGFAQAALVNAPKVVFSGGQLAFQFEPADVRLAFNRLKTSMEQAGGSIKKTFFANLYPLSGAMLSRIHDVRPEFFDPAYLPAGSGVPVEGLPGLDASFSIDAMSVSTR